MMSRERAYTLVELMLVLSLLSILLLIGLPALHQLVSRQRDTVLIDQVVNSLHYARTEAVKRNVHIVVCGSQDGETCDEQWAGDWVVMAKYPTKSVVIQRFNPVPYGGKLTANRHRLVFHPTGISRGTAITLRYLPAYEEQPISCIVVNWVGRITVRQGKRGALC